MSELVLPYLEINDIRMPHGWAMQSRQTMELLVQIFSVEGDHIEIGTGFGGTAILAAVSKHGMGHVYTIDPLTENGFYGGVEPTSNLWPTVEMLNENITAFKLQDQITHIDKFSHPFPLPRTMRFSTGFIDGDHEYEGAFQDWLNIKDLVTEYITFHDVWDRGFPGATKAFVEACRDPDWGAYHVSYNIGILKRLTPCPD